MIVFIEGPRAVGKTFLLDEFFKQNTNPDVMYYKFAFEKYIEDLGMRDQETGPGVHYFSIANVLTILELNRTILKDKILIFDRSIFSAYVWSIYRERMDKTRLLDEFEKVLTGELYQNCVLLYATRKDMPAPTRQEKDYFGNFENYLAEKKIFEEVLDKFGKYISQPTKSNHFINYVNKFDAASVTEFCELINGLSSVTPVLNK